VASFAVATGEAVSTRVLVVEDDADVRSSLSEVLRQEGYYVAEAADGATARELLSEQSFDVVTLDLRLPVLNGVELLASQEKPPPVVVLSAFSYFDQEEVQRRFGNKVSAFLRKPATPRLVLAAVAEAARAS
jgi:CheY-like chemotaxis protein